MRRKSKEGKDSLLHPKLKWLFLHDAIYSVANSILTLFLPIYLLKEWGAPLWFALTPILCAMVTYWGFSFFGYKIQQKIGTKKFFILHIFFSWLQNLSLVFLPFAPKVLIFYYLMFPLVGLISVWQPYQIYIAKYTTRKYRGKQLSLQAIVLLLASALGIFGSSVLLSEVGFVVLMIVQSTLTLCRMLPLLKLDTFYEPQVRKGFLETVRWVVSSRSVKKHIGQIMFGVLGTGNLLWPIVIFLSLKSYIGVGSVLSLALLFQVGFMFLSGMATDFWGRKKTLTLGVVLNSLIWLGRGVILFLPVHVLYFLVLETYTKFVEKTVDLPYQSSNYDKVDDDLFYRVVLDLVEHIGQVGGFLVVVLMVFFFPWVEEYLYAYFFLCMAVVYLLPKICKD